MGVFRINDGVVVDYTNDGWAEFVKWLDGTYAKLVYVWVDEGPAYSIAAIDGRVYRTFSINKTDAADFEARYKINKPLEAQTSDNVLRVSVERPEGSRYTAITPNWCDNRTWYYKAAKQLGQTLTDQGDHIHYRSPSYPKAWVDNYHGRYSNEDFLTTEAGDVPRLKVYVDGVPKTEQDPHDGSGGDYTVDYTNGEVVFLSALTGTEVVTADVYEVNGSEWILKPEAGKKLKIVSAEVQFSRDISIKDSVKFQPYGLVDVFAPQYLDTADPPGPYPSGTLIPLGNPVVYKTMADYINEANGAKPPIPATTEGSPTWRDLTVDVVTYPWDYQAVTELSGAAGMEVRVSLEHDVELGGMIATATFYCLSYSE